MGWHLRSLPRPRCTAVGCDRRSTEELYNARNAPCGTYCGRHAAAALKHAQAEWDAGRP